VAEVGDRCVTKDDCDRDECCVSTIFSIPTGKCKKLITKGEWCRPELEIKERNLVRYPYMCPCGEGMSCVPEDSEVLEGGLVLYKNSKCMEKETTTISYH
ncbi:hypothetical protein NPIL_450401, partial [Nephila pilipes]